MSITEEPKWNRRFGRITQDANGNEWKNIGKFPVDNGVIVNPRPAHNHRCFSCERLFVNCKCSVPETENFICAECDEDN